MANTPNFQSQSGSGYRQKMDTIAQEAFSKWWNGLTKQELLDYIAEQPSLTADVLRQMLADEQAVLSFGMSFHVANNQAVTDFHTDNR